MPTPIWWYESDKEQDQDNYQPFQWNVYNYLKETNSYSSLSPKISGIERIQATGAGCLLIHRRVFKSPLMRKEAWHRKWDRKDGQQVRGLDLAFSERVRKCGFEMWCSWDHKCHHFKELDLLDVLRGFKHWLSAVLEANGGTIDASILGEKYGGNEICESLEKETVGSA